MEAANDRSIPFDAAYELLERVGGAISVTEFVEVVLVNFVTSEVVTVHDPACHVGRP